MNVLNQRSDITIATEDFFVSSDTAGVDLHLRRKRLAHVEKFSSERTLFLMHGATFSSGSLFDAPVGGASLMDQLALNGFDAYAAECEDTALRPGHRKWGEHSIQARSLSE